MAATVETAGVGPYRPSPSLAEKNATAVKYDWEEVSACPVCLSCSLSRLPKLRHIGYSRCRDCGFTFANPIPSNAFLERFYNSDFYNNYRSLEAEQIPSDRYYSASFSDVCRVADLVQIDRSARILDFGCGPGSLVALMRDERGYTNVEGLELNQQSVAVARSRYGLEIASALDQLRERQYDLIFLVEVIEHVPRPREFIDVVSSFLKPGGTLLVTTDSVRNLPSHLFPRYSGHFTGPSHVSLFTETSMSRLLRQSGYKITRLDTDPSHEFFGHAVASPFYAIDFLSPQSKDDLPDLLYVPHGLGAVIGLMPTRRLPRPLRVAKRIDSRIGRWIGKRLKHPPTDHLFVLAVKQGI